MFKLGKINKLQNEKIDISYLTNTKYVKRKKEDFKTLCFDVFGNIGKNEYSFTFELKCKNDELLKLPYNEKINLKDYLFLGETYFCINGVADIAPELDIIIMRYIKNCFIIHAKLFIDTGYNKDEYASIIEFDFNLDDYL